MSDQPMPLGTCVRTRGCDGTYLHGGDCDLGIRFVVEGEPASKARARFTGRGSKVRTYTPERTKEAEGKVAAAYLAVTHKMNGGDQSTAFAVEAEFHLKRNQRRDVDNMLKLVLDGLNKIAWADDSQVVEVTGRKIFNSGIGQTVVTVRDVGTIPRSVSNCEHCGVEFPRPPSHAAKKYCSADCRRDGAAVRRTRTCKHCGSKFTKHSHVSTQEYCSAECGYKARHADAVCAGCGVTFSQPRHLNRSGNSYCSEACKANYWREHRKSAAQGTCQDCGGPTTKKTYKRCQDCHFAAGGRWADRDLATCPMCHSFVSDGGSCDRNHDRLGAATKREESA